MAKVNVIGGLGNLGIVYAVGPAFCVIMGNIFFIFDGGWQLFIESNIIFSSYYSSLVQEDFFITYLRG